jgi:hypothetical protein
VADPIDNDKRLRWRWRHGECTHGLRTGIGNLTGTRFGRISSRSSHFSTGSGSGSSRIGTGSGSGSGSSRIGIGSGSGSSGTRADHVHGKHEGADWWGDA